MRPLSSHPPLLCAAVLAGLLGVSAPAAAEGLDLALTTAVAGADHVRKHGIVLGWTRPRPLWQGEQWRLMLRHEVELATWSVPRARDLVELGYSPVLRLERPLSGGTSVFFVFIAPWRAFTWSHSASSMIRRCGTSTAVTRSSGFSREFRLPVSGSLLKCSRFQTRRPT